MQAGTNMNLSLIDRPDDGPVAPGRNPRKGVGGSQYSIKGVSKMDKITARHIELCGRCNGRYDEEECPHWESSGWLHPDEVSHTCGTCRLSNSVGKYGCPICWNACLDVEYELEKAGA